MHDSKLTTLNALDDGAPSLQPLLPYIISIILLIFPLITYLRSSPPNPRGCRRLGTRKSNIADEFDPQYSEGSPSDAIDPKTGLPAWRIKALFVYPIKSCTGIELDTAEVIDTGLKYDRLFCFAEYIEAKPTPTPAPATSSNEAAAQEATGHWTARTLRDRHFCNLALVRPELWVPDPTSPDYSPSLPEVQSEGVLIIHYPRTLPTSLASLPLLPALFKLALTLRLCPREQSFRVPLTPASNPSPKTAGESYPLHPLKIWKDTPLAHDYGEHLPPSLRRFLADPNTTTQKPLTLFRESAAHHRQIFRNAPPKAQLGFQTVTGFQDAYPLHLLNLASVRDVAARCQTDIPRLTVRRFRANVVVQGPGRFEEDAWRRVRVGGSGGRFDPKGGDGGEERGVEIHLACRTMRCRLPNVDPDTGVRHRAEPDRTLKAYRRIDRGDPTNACLGMQLVPAVRNFTLRVNDPITVLETGEHCYIKMLAPGEVVEGV
ncbi:hypothetical protein ASPACDRAFT_43428 [Aspergillus aculeatus ATCC 16872]|uniref:MOSC domain-containing protein n=1 Tax=Aspergillus aculeatus (strain ATCC 16872 / CBS 172.66 / WB 5094) TaxID=690307 RepID=A0A1L9WUD6_ASPA1|nr:uncharacterized protein ASPACDRAFT_43428 [Aspergillus aculeatus ATCC 16872]OJJ99795.1 hypothetical protein ASPACDRAFT_43428 [Aspergillus aculeatus ATCC 16872]